MTRLEKVLSDFYRDSVALMQLAAKLEQSPGVTRAAAVMATRANLDLLRETGLVESGRDASPNDLLIIVEGDKEAAAEAIETAERALGESAGAAGAPGGAQAARFEPPTSLQMGLEDLPGANLALISTPGEYAAAEAEKALRLGLHTMIFSSGVALDDEIRLKTLARERDLLVMGPDCGTAIIDGIPLGFANVPRSGPVGLVASAGTGAQEVATLLDRAGIGVSQVLGCGSNDLRDEVGAASMLQGLYSLARHDPTQLIVLIAKHPSEHAARRALHAARTLDKPVVAVFLGLDLHDEAGGNLTVANTLEDAARIAAALAVGEPPPPPSGALDPELDTLARAAAERLDPGRRYLRGLFSGGTFCFEAQMLIAPLLGPVWSNAPLDPACALDDPWHSREHTVVDLGDELFTRGRPHPMIDPRLRLERLAREMDDAQTAVILLDLVLGHGAHPDPAPGLAQTVAAARGYVPVVASVCGARDDPQGLDKQEAALREAGVLLAPSNAAAARLAAAIARYAHHAGETP